MLKKANLIVIFLITFGVLIWMFMAIQSKNNITYDENRVFGKFLPDLANKIENVDRITVKFAGGGLIVQRTDSGWVLPEKYNYPVDPEKLREVVNDAAKLEIFEEKTANPDLYKEIAVEDPEKEGAVGVRYIFTDKEGNSIADFIVGKARKTGGGVSDEGMYARRFNDKQSYLLKGNISDNLSPNTMLNKKDFAVPPALIKEIGYQPSSSEGYTVSRIKSGDSFTLIKPDDKELNSDVTTIFGEIMHKLVFRDIIDPKDFNMDGASRITIKTFGDLVVNLIYKADSDGDIVIKISAEGKDEKVKKINDVTGKWLYVADKKSAEVMSYKLEDILKKHNANQ